MVKLSAEQLNTLDKDALIIIATSLQEQLISMSKQLIMRMNALRIHPDRLNFSLNKSAL